MSGAISVNYCIRLSVDAVIDEMNREKILTPFLLTPSGDSKLCLVALNNNAIVFYSAQAALDLDFGKLLLFLPKLLLIQKKKKKKKKPCKSKTTDKKVQPNQWRYLPAKIKL